MRGSWSRLDGVRRRAANRAFLAQNVQFDGTGRVSIRDGLSLYAGATTGKATAMYDWMTAAGGGLNRVLYSELQADGSTLYIQSFDKGNPSAAPVFYYSVIARGIVATEAGENVYIAHYNVSMLGTAPARVFSGQGGSFYVDVAFSPPLTLAPSIADVGAGRVTAGTHKFAYILETRSGFTGKPSPQPGDVFTPAFFTVAAGGRSLSMTINGTLPDNAAYIHPIMTRIDNPDRWYFVPGGSTAVAPGAVNPVFLIDVSDEDLALSAEEATDHFDLFTLNVSGASYWYPHYVFNYGSRVAWLDGYNSTVYFSDQNDPQAISLDQHGKQLPGKRNVVAGCQLRGSAYIFGPDHTYEYVDNGDVPATWSRPSEVSGSIGTHFVLGIDWRTSGDHVWVMHRSGVYFFNGQYGAKPISFFNTREWAQINWQASHAIIVRDFPLKQRLLVSIPSSPATECNFIYSWSYARGVAPEEVDFAFASYYSGIQFGAIGIIRDAFSLEQTFFIAPAGPGAISKEDASAKSDGGIAINAVYETGFVLSGVGRKKINRFGGLDLSIRGAGTSAFYEILGPHHLRSIQGPLSLTVDPGEEPQYRFYLNEEDVTVRLFVNSMNEWFSLAGLTVHHKPYVTNRT